MKGLLLVIGSIVALTVLCGGVYSDNTHTPTIPLFVWSSNSLFPTQNTQILDTLTVQDIDDSLQALLFKTNSQNFIKSTSTPESVVLFVESQLQTDQIPHFGAAYATTTNGGAFSSLKNIVESSTSSLVAPYVTVGTQFSLLDSVLARIVRKLSKGSALIIRQEGSTLFNALSRSDNVQTMSMNDFKAETFSNGIPALVIVCLDKAEDATEFVAHDTAIKTITAAVSSSTRGNYIAMYTGNSASSSTQYSFPSLHKARMYVEAPILGASQNCTGNCTRGPHTYLTGPIIEAFMVLITLLTMLLVGICNLCSLQVPEQFETPKVQKQALI